VYGLYNTTKFPIYLKSEIIPRRDILNNKLANTLKLRKIDKIICSIPGLKKEITSHWRVDGSGVK
jgi:hypothetical protein